MNELRAIKVMQRARKCKNKAAAVPKGGFTEGGWRAANASLCSSRKGEKSSNALKEPQVDQMTKRETFWLKKSERVRKWEGEEKEGWECKDNPGLALLSCLAQLEIASNHRVGRGGGKERKRGREEVGARKRRIGGEEEEEMIESTATEARKK